MLNFLRRLKKLSGELSNDIYLINNKNYTNKNVKKINICIYGTTFEFK